MIRKYFSSLENWPVDMAGCAVVAVFGTPADPMSVVLAFPIVLSVWMFVRWMIYRRLTR